MCAGGALERASVCTGVSGAWACLRTGVWRAGVRVVALLCGRACGFERGRTAVRAATGVLFTREHVLHPK
ncbi:hypothetical protein CDL15_Pgr008650 [Punica granatum]|uniref:Uncharacterized protein n=1 Tax=Punica granatum TaxID=22663 RepID=A0A218XDJ7_PUNGR|nr:hypothetical protein CDL15_Pgr008650 [Punica granatum]PKI67598.1 hypothetical protein CRG98_012021 [Punica granatum]